jgi:hypothetical protein
MTRIFLALTLGLSLVGCRQSATAPSDALPGEVTSAALIMCVEETNRYRAMVGAPAVTRSPAIEAHAAAAARADGLSGTPHGYVSQNPPPGQWGENEVLGLGLKTSGSVQNVVRTALISFWASPPHYAVMASARYSEVGCGLFLNGNHVTVVQHFR